MKRVAITGGRGRLASGLAGYLRELGWEVVLFSRTGGGEFGVLGDLAEPRTLSGFEAVLHLGWSSVPLVSEGNPGIEEREDLPFARTLVEAAQRCEHSPRLVFFSTAAVYGNTGDAPVEEEVACRPMGRYAAAKLKAEEVFLQAPVACVLRITNVFSLGCAKTRSQGIIPILLESARTGSEVTLWGDGSAMKDYIAASDLHSAVYAVLERGLMGTFNVASGHSLSINALIALVECAAGRALSVRHTAHFAWDVEKAIISSARLRQATGWSPLHDPESAIAAMVKTLEAS